MHPDKPAGDKRQFQDLQKAYALLSDAKRREDYDQHGDVTEETVAQKAERELCGVLTSLAQSVQNPETENLLHEARDGIQRTIAKNTSAACNSLCAIDRMEQVLARLGKNGGGKGPAHAAIEAAVAGMRQQVAAIEKQNEVGAEMLRLLGEYSYRTEPKADERRFCDWESMASALYRKP